MTKLEEFLSTLTEEQRAMFKSVNTEEAPPKKRGRPRKTTESKQEVEPTKKASKKSSKKVIKFNTGDREDEEGQLAKSKAAKPKGETKRTPTRIEPFVLGPRPNKFETSSVFNAKKEDSEIDRKLWTNRRPSERDRSTICEIECTRCHRLYEIGIGLAHKDYVCDRCVTAK